MKKNQNRIYSCKDEELLPISKFTLFSLRRDLAEFTAFSGQFNEQYVTETEAIIQQVETLLEPESETLASKLITQTLEDHFTEENRLLLTIEGYLKLSKKEIRITPAALGITTLRKKLHLGDVEGILNGIKVLLSNLQSCNAILEQKGMPADTIQKIQELHKVIGESKQKQYEIKTNRAGIVQNNIQLFNNLYLQLVEIFSIGKVLYKNTNPAKYKDYTFSQLKKKVRNVKSSTTDFPTEATNS